MRCRPPSTARAQRPRRLGLRARPAVHAQRRTRAALVFASLAGHADGIRLPPPGVADAGGVCRAVAGRVRVVRTGEARKVALQRLVLARGAPRARVVGRERQSGEALAVPDLRAGKRRARVGPTRHAARVPPLGLVRAAHTPRARAAVGAAPPTIARAGGARRASGGAGGLCQTVHAAGIARACLVRARAALHARAAVGASPPSVALTVGVFHATSWRVGVGWTSRASSRP